MKHILGALLFLIFLHSANAETKNTEIIKIETIEGESLIFAGNGWQQFELKKAYKNAVGWRAKVPKL